MNFVSQKVYYRRNRDRGVTMPGNSLAFGLHESEVLPLLALSRRLVEYVRLLDPFPRHLPPQDHRQRDHAVAVQRRRVPANLAGKAASITAGTCPHPRKVDWGMTGLGSPIGLSHSGSDSLPR